MAATMEERLDELLGKAREAARLGNEAAHLDRAADNAGPSDRERARRLAREAAKAHAHAEDRLATLRSRFLAALGMESAS